MIIHLDVLRRYKDLSELCEYLSMSSELFQEGYVETKQEQRILNELGETKALELWAMHEYAHGNLDHEHVYEKFVLDPIVEHNKEQKSYHNQVLLAHEGIIIEDPFYDETGRNKVDPISYYGESTINQMLLAWEEFKNE